MDEFLNMQQAGTFKNYSQIDGFMLDTYRVSLKQILKHQVLIGVIFFAELLFIALLITLLLIDDFPNNLRLIVILYTVQIIFTQIQNGSYYKKKQEQHLIENIQIYILINIILSIFQQDYILFLRFCRIEINYNSQKYNDNLLRYKYYHFLIKWFSMKKLFLLIKVHLIFLYIVTTAKHNYILTFYIGILLFLSVEYLIIQNIYLSIFIFQKKQTLFKKIITFFESFFGLIQSLFYVYQILFNLIQFLAFVSMLLIYTCFLSCELQYEDLYNPLSINIFQQILMGQNLVYISPLLNNDIVQYEIIFQNVKNLIQYCSCQFYLIVTCYLVYFYEDYQISYSIKVIQFLLIIYTILISLLKLHYLIKMYILNKHQSVQSISDINTQSLEQKCRNVILVKEKLKSTDELTKFINFKNQYFFIVLENQFSLEQINGCSMIKIFSLESFSLIQTYTIFLKNSKKLSVKFNLLNEQIGKQNKEQLFSILKQTSIPDQITINIEDSDIVKQFKTTNIYEDLIKCLNHNNYYQTILHILTYQNNISQFQIINPNIILFDLFDTSD